MRAPLVAIFLVLAAPASVAQTSGNPAIPCYRALTDDPRLAAIRDKVALGGDAEDMRRLSALPGRPSPLEAEALVAWKVEREACHRRELPYYATRDAEIRVLAQRHFSALQAAIDELSAGRLTYGEFSKRRIALYEKLNQDIEDVRRAILPPKPVPKKPDTK
jgi:hypothetical protein